MIEESVVPIKLHETSLLTPLVTPPETLKEFSPFGDSIWSFCLHDVVVRLPFKDAMRISRYDTSTPTGVILGKCWRIHRADYNKLATFWSEDPVDPNTIHIKYFSILPTSSDPTPLDQMLHYLQHSNSGDYNRSFFLPWQQRKGDACGNWEFWKGPNSPRG